MISNQTTDKRSFREVHSIVVPLDQSNIDTDVILPKQFLKRVEKSGYGNFLFYDWRYLNNDMENPNFILNKHPYRESKILLSRKNFGSGSSREHAPWSLHDFGIRVIIASSFADIFYNNCIKNGILPIRLDEHTINQLFELTKDQPLKMIVKLETKTIEYGSYHTISFEIDNYSRYMLLNGLDEIALTLKHEEKLKAFEERHKIYYSIY
ncbi:3-isopropylmalate/(R)-2-methylmalate dehydratase small subunit [Evansella vedderi]|uniref:3-isopropylmalate dehydratase small subunit n=1 Tax=Evansella vedderi TaxID=38282 RepID=A0ABU0A1S1_9BACI|nr:3-isopropylmalate dehydratase small subunit [Evansella vedderi]MDQ0256300.1 3-isopropylmalate/(R)-2-methylmalate dehydratase small subunit [Evansella vedderi]